MESYFIIHGTSTEAIYYTRRAIENEKDTSRDARVNNISRWNTIALCWQKMGNYDSAFHYFDIAMQMANALNSEVWKGIISGNKGQIYFLQKKYDIAKPLFEFDYHTSKQYGRNCQCGQLAANDSENQFIAGKKRQRTAPSEGSFTMLQQHPQPIH